MHPLGVPPRRAVTVHAQCSADPGARRRRSASGRLLQLYAPQLPVFSSAFVFGLFVILVPIADRAYHRLSTEAGPSTALPFHLNLTVCSRCTGVPVHTRRILLPGLSSVLTVCSWCIAVPVHTRCVLLPGPARRGGWRRTWPASATSWGASRSSGIRRTCSSRRGNANVKSPVIVLPVCP